MSIEGKIDILTEKVSQQNVTLAEIRTYQKVQAEKLKVQDTQLTTLNAFMNNSIGRNAILSAIFGAVGTGITFLIKALIA